MAISYGFHPDALTEYTEATRYYISEASLRVAGGFISAVESSIASLVSAPDRWRVVQGPEIRRCILKRFPFVVYYRWEARHQRITIYAIMHCSREPGYWNGRMGGRIGNG
ncbi:MAG: type II toxin-antitoxin system RelE/ParE family toxin [bacterium]